MFHFRFATLKVHAIVSSILLGDVVQCIPVISLLVNKARSLLTAWGRVLCTAQHLHLLEWTALQASWTDGASLCGVETNSSWSRSTPKRMSYREHTTLQTEWSRCRDHEVSSWSGAEPWRRRPISDSKNRRNGVECSNVDANCDVIPWV